MTPSPSTRDGWLQITGAQAARIFEQIHCEGTELVGDTMTWRFPGGIVLVLRGEQWELALRAGSL